MNSDEIGIVVIGRNEGQRLVDCLLSLKSSPNKIVYVDSGSTDRSTAMAASLGAYVVRLDERRPFTAARARNEGLTALKELSPDARYVQFVDGDCEVDGGWIATAAAFLQKHSDVAIVCGRRRERFPDKSIYNALADIEWDTPCGETSSCGGDSMARIDVLGSVGGFCPKLMAGEEPELCARLRQKAWKIWRLDTEMTRHDINLVRFSQWWRRVVRSGYGYAQISTLTRCAPSQLYRAEANRAIFWGGVLPAALVGAVMVHPVGLALGLIYPLQVIRLAFRRGPDMRMSWYYAAFIVIAKFAEFEGVLKFHWYYALGNSFRRIDYKGGEA